MEITAKDFIRKLFWIIIGALLIYFAIRIVIGEIVARRYQESFGQLQHPADTTLVDSLHFRFSDYPATYVDESIKFKCTLLIGEIRTYADHGATVRDFYTGSNLQVNLLPLKVSDDSTSLLLDETNKLQPDPSDFDVIDELQNYYSSSRGNQQFDPQSHYYLVYTLTDTPCTWN